MQGLAVLQRKSDFLDAREERAIQTILVVDDSRAQRRVLTAMLTRWGYQPISAASGQEALEICKTQPVDLVISDWVMPGMSGLEFCKAYRALSRSSYGYFVLLTSMSEFQELAMQ